MPHPPLLCCEVIVIQRSNSETLTTYTVVSFLSHAVVYAFLLFSVPEYGDGWRYLHYLVTFDVCAFSAAPLMGIIADTVENCHRIAQCGVILQLCGILFPYKWEAEFLDLPVAITIKMILLGIGFGLFHVFAAATVLRRDCGRCLDIGIFLAPGSLGVAAILILPKLGYYALPLLAFAAAMSDNGKAFGLSLPRPKEKHFPLIAASGVLALLLALAVFSANLPSLDAIDRRDRLPLLLLACALAGGKVVGGLLCDLLGPISVLCFPLGALLIGSQSALVSALGTALFATAIPIAFRLVAGLIPSAPGFAYGLCSCVLFPIAWLHTRQPQILSSLFSSPLLSGICMAIAAATSIFLCAKYGILCTKLIKWLRRRTARSMQPSSPAPEAEIGSNPKEGIE